METLCKMYLELANVVPNTCLSSRELALTERAASLETQLSEAHEIVGQKSEQYIAARKDADAAHVAASEALQECERLRAALEEISSMEIAIVSPLARRALGAAK